MISVSVAGFYVAILGLVVVLIVDAVLSYRAGWLAAAAYLEAAKAVSAIADSAGTQAAKFNTLLAQSREETALFRAALDRNTETADARGRILDDTLHQLFQGFESAGVVRRGTSPRLGRQHGEPPDEDSGD